MGASAPTPGPWGSAPRTVPVSRGIEAPKSKKGLSEGAQAGIALIVIFVVAGIAIGVGIALSRNPCGGTATVQDVQKAMLETAKQYPQGIDQSKITLTTARTVTNLLQERADIPCNEVVGAARHYVRLCSDVGYMEACTSGSPSDQQLLKLTGTVDGCPLTTVPVYIYTRKVKRGQTIPVGVPCSLIRPTDASGQPDLTNQVSIERREKKEQPFGPNPPTTTSSG